jgi:anti-sigma regulatory factor (Ser/Thr protein kinase)
METMIGADVQAPGSSTLLIVDEQSQIGAARRSAVVLGHAHGLGAEAVGRLAIVVTEAATNIVRHAGRGVIVLRALHTGTTAAIEMLALDKGPGIPDVARAMRNGYSTSGTSGQGLGGIQRLADLFGIHSEREKGTALLARIGESGGLRIPGGPRLHVVLDDRLGVVCVPKRGETACGDDWRIVARQGLISVLLVDGLGHGPEAAVAAAAATSAFTRLEPGTPETALATLHTAMRATRGAALSVAIIDEASSTMSLGGVGNVDVRILSDGPTEHLAVQNGIVGHTMPTPRSTAAGWPDGARLVMHSDGISARWRMEAYPGLMSAHPALIAGVIYRDFARERDDATVLVLSEAVAEGRQ